ncbi:MAG: lpxA [Chlamydiales bacterium]|jgi:UDP-N-acetylglucosamine acyltransferase|nr:lpxA [Chlamydiales bacterium]
MSHIHPTAIIEPGAQIGENVTVEPYAIIKSNVVLEDHVHIKSHAYIDGHTTIGKGTTIWPFASIGTKTQDLKFKGEKTFVVIGQNCEIRESVTINSSTGENSVVKVGDNCLIMAYCHVAHNCEVGNNVIMSNGATLAGHVIVEDHAIIAGMTPVHQFVRVGRYAMVGGMSRVTHDIPPFTIGAGIPYKIGGLNLVGLKRHNFSLETRKNLTKAFKLVYRSGLRLEEALRKIEEELPPIHEVKQWVQFCRESTRGLICLQGVNNQGDELEE